LCCNSFLTFDVLEYGSLILAMRFFSKSATFD